MEDKSFYLSDLALEMLVSSQGTQKIPLPTAGNLRNAAQEEMIKELYSLVQNGILENDEVKGRFILNKDLAPLIKVILGSKSVIRITDMRRNQAPFYCYLTKDTITLLESSTIHGGAKLGIINAETLAETLFQKLDIAENTVCVSNGIRELEMSEESFFAEMLSIDITELKNGFGDVEGCIDLISCENFNTVCRVAIFKKEQEYEITLMTDKKILVYDYTFENFSKAIERMAGENE